MSIGLGEGVLGSGTIDTKHAKRVDISQWRVVFDGAQIWLGCEDEDGSTVQAMRLRPVLRVREVPVTVPGKPGSFQVQLVVDTVLSRLPALPYIDVSRERTTVPVTSFGEDSYWVNVINEAILQARARNSGLTI